MYKVRLKAALLAVAIAAPGLADVTGAAPGLDDYYPLREGRSWVFRSAGGRAEARATKAGLELPQYFDGMRRTERLTFEKGRLILNGIDSPEPNEITPGIHLLVHPLRSGAAWSSKGKWANAYDLVLTGKVAGFESVRVPAGLFRCAKVELKYSFVAGGGMTYDYTRTLWLAPGVGIVRHVFRHVGGSTGTLELESYRR